MSLFELLIPLTIKTDSFQPSVSSFTLCHDRSSSAAIRSIRSRIGFAWSIYALTSASDNDAACASSLRHTSYTKTVSASSSDTWTRYDSQSEVASISRAASDKIATSLSRCPAFVTSLPISAYILHLPLSLASTHSTFHVRFPALTAHMP